MSKPERLFLASIMLYSAALYVWVETTFVSNCLEELFSFPARQVILVSIEADTPLYRLRSNHWHGFRNRCFLHYLNFRKYWERLWRRSRCYYSGTN